ncbi:hypothetical protein [Haladaptatus sp. T7]|uniref:hypothetical protein n=1 Tax=Haladaptatus sp. T7 TaxID=2029368 RepID=UPI0021A25861|nr:hypothetical protein [Haladaptatus sp. T7]GKZ16074.1 hypothetical protein HAL_39550 [Haladaptatus sp. T7]
MVDDNEKHDENTPETAEKSNEEQQSTSGQSGNGVFGMSQINFPLKDLDKVLVPNQNLTKGLDGVYKWQQSMAEVTAPIRKIEQTNRALNQLDQAIQAVSTPSEELQQTVSAVQGARAIAQAYNQQWEAIEDAFDSLHDDIKVAVEEQITLEMPWNYKSTDPNPAAKAAAENWVERFISDFEDVDDEYFERLFKRVEDGFDEFKKEPDRPYSTIHIFISMQDALLFWLCYQDRQISSNETNDVGLPKYKTEHKQNALRKYYNSYFGVDEGDNTKFSDYKWDCFWAHRHSIMHGDVYATYDMNIATTSMLFFALTADSVLQVIATHDENGEDIPSVLDQIEQTEEVNDEEDVDPAETLGTFMKN